MTSPNATNTSLSNEGAAPPPATRKLRISAKLRRAIDLIAIQGMSGRKAAEAAGLHEVSLYKALAKPHVAEALEARKAEIVLEADKLKGVARAIAIRTGIELMADAKSEAVKARMVEFFAGEPRASANVAVQVNVDRGGYEYARPGAQVVEIIDHGNQAPDAKSGDDAE